MDEYLTMIVAVVLSAVVLLTSKMIFGTGVRSISRLPSHVGVVLQDGMEQEFEFISNLIRWISDAGINTVSLYNTQGLSKKVISELSVGFNVSTASELLSEPTNRNIILLTYADGRILPQSFDDDHRLPAFKSVADPDLIIIFGKSKSIYGYPPWYLSLSELRFHSATPSSYSSSVLHSDLLHFSDTKVQLLTHMQHERYVEFEVANGDLVRFTEGDGAVMEEVHTRGRWRHMGTATKMIYEPRKRILTDQNGQGGVIPKSSDLEAILDGVVEVAVASGISHNIRSKGSYQTGAATAEFTAPSGDIIKFVATDKGVEEQIMSLRTGSWTTIGMATELLFNKTKKSLVDQNGSGGVLPSAGLPQLLSRIKIVAEQAAIKHNIPSESRRTSKRPSLRLSGSSCASNSASSVNSSTASQPLYPGAESRLKVLIVCDTSNPDKIAVASSLKACEEAAVLAERMEGDVRRITKVITKASIEMGLSWLCIEDSIPGDALLLIKIGDFSQQSLTKGDWLYYLSQVPVGCKLTIVSDGKKNALQLPFSCTATVENTSYVEDVSRVSEWKKIKANIIQIASPTLRSAEIGVFTEAVVSFLLRNRCPGLRELACGCCRSLSAKGITGKVTLSSTRVFDALVDRFTICDWDGIPIGRQNPQLKFRYESSDSVSVSSSISEDLSSSRYLGDYNNEIRDALIGVYTRHNKLKLPLVNRFVTDFRGRYRHLFHILSLKYNNPDILDLYSPAWGT